MSFQQGGGLGRRRGSAGAGWWLRRRGVAPDAHTPTPTNYHCVTGNKEEVKTEAAPKQMSQFVRFTPESV